MLNFSIIGQRDDVLSEARVSQYVDEAVSREVYQEDRSGALAETPARASGWDAAGIRTLPARVRYQRIKALSMDFVPNNEFRRATAAREKILLGPPPAPAKRPPRVQPTAGMPPYLANLYEVPLLTREQEIHLFRKMNYLKYQVSKLVARLDPQRPDNAALDRIEQLYQQVIEVKNALIQANLRLVVAMTKRYACSREPLFELVSDGNMSLLRAVEKFDYARGARFSTYASAAIIKNFTQTISKEYRDRSRFRNAVDELFQSMPDQRTSQLAEEAARIRREGKVARLLEQLDDRERQIIRYRFGLDSPREPMTLKEVGSVLGVSKERIRQLAARALAKLRQAAVECGFDESDDRPVSEAGPLREPKRFNHGLVIAE